MGAQQCCASLNGTDAEQSPIMAEVKPAMASSLRDDVSESSTKASSAKSSPSRGKRPSIELGFRPFLGRGMETTYEFHTAPLGIEFHRSLPITVKKVQRGSAAQKMGLEAGAILVRLNGEDISATQWQDLRDQLLELSSELRSSSSCSTSSTCCSHSHAGKSKRRTAAANSHVSHEQSAFTSKPSSNTFSSSSAPPASDLVEEGSALESSMFSTVSALAMSQERTSSSATGDVTVTSAQSEVDVVVDVEVEVEEVQAAEAETILPCAASLAEIHEEEEEDSDGLLSF